MPSLYKTLLFFSIYTLNVIGHAQDTLVINEWVVPKIKSSLTKDPKLLAEALVNGKTSDKEKFDAIYAWVSNNIQYDYRRYNSGRSFSNMEIKKTLKSRRAICTDYARLMDTLCGFAGIENTSIYGYAKEIIFDVDDPIFVDNHAWNAVKLNGYWYLYDITWSKVGKVYDYTRLAKWRIRIIDKILKKAKKGTIELVMQKKGNKFCGIPNGQVLSTANYTTLRFFPFLVTKILSFPAFRIKEIYSEITNKKYYLSQPEIFAIDHFPDFPAWSLTTFPSNVEEFSADKNYFNVSLQTEETQTRRGSVCFSCEDYLHMDPIHKEKKTILESKINNPKNKLLIANTNLEMADLYFQEVLLENDSTAKLALIDSVLYHIKESRIEYTAARAEGRNERRFHTVKNKKKRDILIKENKNHLLKVTRAFKMLNQRHIKIKSLTSKSKMYKSAYKRNVQFFKIKLWTTINSRTLSDKREDKLIKDLIKNKRISDSINVWIQNQKDTFIVNASLVWKNVIEELNYLNSVESNFFEDSRNRIFHLYDNYDKTIIEIRKVLNEKEKEFLSTLEQKVLFPSDSLYSQFMILHKQIKKRNVLDLQAAKTIAKLYAGKKLMDSDLEEAQRQKEERMVEDICWMTDTEFLVKNLTKVYRNLHKQNKKLSRVIKNNSDTETFRYRIFSRHIEGNDRRVKHAITSNLSTAKKMKQALLRHRAAYLKKLKKQR